MVQLGRGRRPGRRGVGLGAAHRPGRVGSPVQSWSRVSGALDQLLVVQDLDTAITQLQHRRAALPERTGLTGLEVELANLNAEKIALMGRRAELMATQKD